MEEGPTPAGQVSFYDGYRAAGVCDAILTAAREARRIEIAGPGESGS